MNLPYIILPILVGLICGILGFMLGKRSTKDYRSLATVLQEDLDVCKANTKNLMTKVLSLENELLSKATPYAAKSFKPYSIPVPEFDNELATKIMGKRIRENDLKIVEGIGPKVEFLLNEAKITSWYALSEADTAQLFAILDAGGENSAIHNPSTWPKQALLAYNGKWEDLKDWQDSLLGGKE